MLVQFTMILTLILHDAIGLIFQLTNELDKYENDLDEVDTGSHICGYCLCDRKHRIRTCSNLNLQTFKTDETFDWNWVETLDLSRNNFTEIPNLRMYENLKYLNLSFNDQLKIIGENSFDGLEKLRSLDLSSIALTFERRTVHPETFSSLKLLTRLRMKQQTVQPSIDADYSFLLRVSDSLQELNIIGHPDLVSVFEHNFPNLQNLSLGGNNCNLTGLFGESQYLNLTKLPLKKLSMRNCLITNISADYFKTLAKTLKKLDISCNPVHEAFLNISHGFAGGDLETVIADFINQGNGPTCSWNISGETFLPSFRRVSLQGNRISHLLQGTDTRSMKNFEYLDLSYNTLGGSAFNLRCDLDPSWFWCHLKCPKLKYLGVSGVTRDDQACGQQPDRLLCNEDSELYANEEFDWEYVSNPYILDIFTIGDFVSVLNQTLENDIKKLISNDFNNTALSRNSVVRIFSDVVFRHPETGIPYAAILRLISNITINKDFITESLMRLPKYFCDEKRIIVLIETLSNWVHRAYSAAITFPDEAISKTFHGVCAHEDWGYGVNFITRSRFRILFTNLTTVVARDNEYNVLRTPGIYCNDLVFFYNNMRSVDFSYSHTPYVACSNMSGWDYVKKIVCIGCSNTDGVNITAEDAPNLAHIDWSNNLMGDLLREKVIFRGYTNLEVIRLDNQQPPVKYFRHKDMFADHQKLLELSLSACGIEMWNVSLALNTVLKKLNLHGNMIKYIDKPFRKDLMAAYNKSGLRVDLSGNSPTCTCDHKHLGYINWLLQTKLVIKRNELRCADMTLLKDFAINCSSNSWSTWQILVVSTLAILFGAVIFTRIGFAIRKMITSSPNQYNPLPPGSLPVAFISFPQRMMDDVNVLREMTRNWAHLHSSSWDLSDGQLISSGLSDAILHATKFILIVSKDYFKDDNTSLEYRIMENAGLIQPEKVILILTTPNLREIQLPVVLQQLYVAGEFLIWPTNFCGSLDLKRFVEQLVAKIS